MPSKRSDQVAIEHPRPRGVPAAPPCQCSEIIRDVALGGSELVLRCEGVRVACEQSIATAPSHLISEAPQSLSV